MGTYLVKTISLLLAVSQTIAAAKLAETQGQKDETESVENSLKGKKNLSILY